jgi:DNA-binding transcriptional MerR regulator
MPIGTLSEQTGCHIETIRYYERIGLMPKPARTEVRTMLEMVDGGNLTCQEVKDVTVKHLDDVREKFSDLQKLEKKRSNELPHSAKVIKRLPAQLLIRCLNEMSLGSIGKSYQ